MIKSFAIKGGRIKTRNTDTRGYKYSTLIFYVGIHCYPRGLILQDICTHVTQIK